jgi:hypothetical protein
METLKSHYERVRHTTGDYVRLPAGAAARAGVQQEPESSIGCNARLKAISEFLGPKNCDFAVDLGGNCAFFCLSLLEQNVIKRAKVVEQLGELVEFGRHAAGEMGLSDRISFEAQTIELSRLHSMPMCDVVICQNLIHHAGAWFDVEAVTRDGWRSYARRFMAILREKAKYGVICMNMMRGRPVNWEGVKDEKKEKAARFTEILQETGWSIRRQTWVYDLVRNGEVQLPVGRRSDVRGPAKWLFKRNIRSAATKASMTASKLLGQSRLGSYARNLPFARAYKQALEKTASIKTDEYYLYLLE